MQKRVVERAVAILLLISLVLGGGAPLGALAQEQGAGADLDYYAQKAALSRAKIEARIDQTDREAAAQRAAEKGFVLPEVGAGIAQLQPGAAPHYFSHPNYANSPLPVIGGQPTPVDVGNPLVDRANATDYPVGVGELAPVLVVLPTGLPAGTLDRFRTWNQAGGGALGEPVAFDKGWSPAAPEASPFPSAGNVFHAYVLRPTGVPNQYSVVADSGLLTVPPLADPGVSELAEYVVTPIDVLDGDLLAFYGQGIPVDVGGGADILSYPAPAAPLAGDVVTLGDPAFPVFSQDRIYSFGAVVNVTTPTVSGGIRKFVDALPWAPGGDPLPVAVSTDLGDGTDYYEIGLIQYRQKMHTDLPPTLLRGYVQLADCASPGAVPLSNENLDPLQPATPTGYCGVTAPTYLGPTIIAQKDKAVRILFRNLLPAGEGGNLFLPTDTTVMGSGMGPDLNGMPEVDPQHPTCEAIPKPQGCFTENRADLHLHGGLTPWISDGTPHQWITPATEALPYPDADLVGLGKTNTGVSMAFVPDMWYDGAGGFIGACFGQTTCNVPGATNNPGLGAQTYYYTNQQSARLLFYHDHAWGITRLNVYAGEAAAYLIQDPIEHALTGTGGALEGLGVGIPLVIQDKTFVPSTAQLAVSDNTWDASRWGGEGNLWLPHVYSPAQNPGDASGVNQFGRWAYGPWFWPPTLNIAYPPIANPYFDPNCNPDQQWCEPPLMPGTPYNSMGMEAFHDTPLVNGKAYPTVTLDPQEYRFRVLNAASDRFFNLSLYVADPAADTEVQLNPAEVAAALLDPTIFPTPVAGTEGPAWVQIGTEGGFLPAPAVVPNQYITWVTDPTVFNAGNVDLHSLLLGPAERADVVVDLTPFAGMTLILYNDAPAAFPARDPRYDYYTGNGDYRDTGGAPSTLPGYGPNTRTVMQIKVNGTPGTPVPNWVNPGRLAALESAFLSTSQGGQGVFENGQHPIIVGQGEYNSAYGTSFQTNGPMNGTVQIYDTSLTFNVLPQVAGDPLGTLTMGLGPKMIQDEMGEAFDRDYGRMSGFLGLESPNAGAGQQNMILYPYVNPASELIDATNLPSANLDVTPIAAATDGSQIWKITHNGVDTHPIHFHLFDVQLINRVGWDGIIRKPDATELGWKDTVRISPLEDTIVALRPVIPVTPFDAAIPVSFRPLNPAMPTGSTLMFTNMDMWGQPTVPIVNEWTNFGWEYVWHCHILSHEEMDMMRPISVSVPPAKPTSLSTVFASSPTPRITLTWTDNSRNETGFTVRRAVSPTGPWATLAVLDPDTTSYVDILGPARRPLFYQVLASNRVGYSFTPGYSTLETTSASDVVVNGPLPPTLPAAPSLLTAAVEAGPRVRLTWRDNASNEAGFVVERRLSGGEWALLAEVGPKGGTGTNQSYLDLSVVPNATYEYRVAAINGRGWSGYSNVATVTISGVPAAPSGVQATAVRSGQNAARITLTWVDNANNETGFTIQRATDPNFTLNLVTVRAAANATTYTTGPVPRFASYYLRIASINGSGASAWVNAAPFPVTTP
jgi:FtsP/CotA-like multicopper oxidase with cupredoxin domain